MYLALIVVVGVLLIVLFVVALLYGLRQFTRALARSGQVAIDARFPKESVLLSDALALSFGIESKGAKQGRGNGALVLTAEELFFRMYAGGNELRIPLANIEAVSLVRSHLGKTQFVDLLHVRFVRDGESDSIAWRVPNPDEWKTKLDALRG